MIFQRISLPRLLTVITLVILGIAIVASKDDAKSVIRIFLESSWPSIIIWLLAIIGVGAGRVFMSPPIQKNPSFMYQSFGTYADSIFAIATYGLSGSTSLALLKGLFLQVFFSGSYFSGFGDFDLASIFVISSFLLFYSAVGVVKELINAVSQAEATEVTPS